MGVRFFIGRAGTGKSTALLREIAAEQARLPLGPPLLLIVPEQFTFTAERMLLAALEKSRGSFRAQVLSFARFALLLARQKNPAAASEPMSELIRLTFLEETIRTHTGQLGIFASVAHHAGFIQRMDRTLRELRRHDHTAATLHRLIERGAFDEVTRRKIMDLAALLEVWSPLVDAAGALDAEHLLKHATHLVAEGGLASETKIWIDGFSTLTPLETCLVTALARAASQLTLTLCADPDAEGFQQKREVPGVFTRTERLHRHLEETFQREAISIDETKLFRIRHRFQSPALVAIEDHLFRDSDNARSTIDTAGVEVWECSDPETEVRSAAQAIRTAVLADSKLRYRDIGLIVPALDAEGGAGGNYEDAIRRIFREHNIPHFIDRRRSIAHHPLVELLRSAVAIVTRRWNADDVLLYLKTNLTGIGEEDAATTENYVLAHGISHTAWDTYWHWAGANQREDDNAITPADAERLRIANIVRNRTWTDLHDWIQLTAASNEPREVAAYVAGLQSLLTRLDIETRMKTMISDAQSRGDAELAQIHQQAWRQVSDLLTLLAAQLTGRARTLLEFEQLLASALETLTLGLIPPTVDQLLVSSVTRSRVPELKRVFILGAREGIFPHIASEDPILSDTQREALNTAEENAIGPGGERQLMEMEFFDYLAFTRARDSLVISYPIANRQGKSVTPSRYIARLRELLGETLTLRRFDAATRWSLDHIATTDDVLAATAAWARRRISLPLETHDAHMPAVYDWIIQETSPAIAAAKTLVWPAILGMPEPHLSEQFAEQFYPSHKPLRMSVTQLEKFGSCPLQYFLHYTLGLKPRDILQLDSMDLGTLYHAILENVFLRIIDNKLPWPGCSPEQLREAVEGEVENACKKLHAELADRTPAYAKIKQRTKVTLTLIMESQRRRAAHGSMRPAAVELTFGSSDKSAEPTTRISLPVLKIPFAEKRELHLNGKIDRVDASDSHAAVYDYKSSADRTLKLSHIYFGLSLQLPVYALVMRDLWKHQPVAGLYVSLGLHRQTIKRPMDAAGPESDEFFQNMKPRGVIDDDNAPELDASYAHDKASDWFSMALTKKDQTPTVHSDVLLHNDFELMLRYVEWKVADIAGQLTRGEIAPMPFKDAQKTPCDFCDFASLCMFDRAVGNYRPLSTLKKPDAIERMREKLAEVGEK